MRISDNHGTLPSSPLKDATPVQPTEGASGASATSTTQGAAQVTVSSKARELAEAHASSASASDVKIAALRGAISSGSFKLDPQKIAQRIVDGDTD